MTPARPIAPEAWIECLRRRAAAVGEAGEVPVAAVVLDGQGRAIGWGSNRRERDQQPLGHAELVALQQAASLAMRDAAAKIAVEFREQAIVRGLIEPSAPLVEVPAQPPPP